MTIELVPTAMAWLGGVCAGYIVGYLVRRDRHQALVAHHEYVSRLYRRAESRWREIVNQANRRMPTCADCLPGVPCPPCMMAVVLQGQCLEHDDCIRCPAVGSACARAQAERCGMSQKCDLCKGKGAERRPVTVQVPGAPALCVNEICSPCWALLEPTIRTVLALAQGRRR